METRWIPEVLRMVGEIVPDGVSIAVSDRQRYVYYQPSDWIDLKIKPGDQVPKGSATYQALTARQKVADYVESSVFGVPYYGVSVPLLRNGQIEGCITAIYARPLAPAQEAPARPRVLIGRGEDCWIPLSPAEIVLIRSHQGRTLLQTENGAFVNRYSLNQLERMLDPGQFVRCHRSYLVNIAAIRRIEPHFHSTFLLEMKDSQRTRVPVSQSYASRFRELLGF